MASLAEMGRELTAKRTRAGLEVARQLGRKRKMTDSKIASARKLLVSGVPRTGACPCPLCTARFRHLRRLSVSCDPFSEVTPL